MNMEKFWDAIDLGENLGRCLGVVRGYSGLQAAVMAFVTAMLAITTGALAWRFDIMSTITAMDRLVGTVVPSLPDRVAGYATLVVFALTLAPTLMELGGAAFARSGATPFQWMVIVLSIFDLFTDAPETTAFVNQADWSVFGLFEWPAYAIAWVAWLG